MLSSELDQQDPNGHSLTTSPASPPQSNRSDGQARGPQAHRPQNEDNAPNQVPRDAWEDHSGDFPPRITSISTRTVAIRGGQLVTIQGENFRGGVQVVLICGQVGDGRTSLKVITPRINTSTELEFDSPCLLDWWQQASSKLPMSAILFQVSLSCSGVVPDPDKKSDFEIIGREDSEVDLLHAVVELHRQVIRNTIQTRSPTEDLKAVQKTKTLLGLEQPLKVSRTEHLALGAMYMLCDSHDQISANTLHQIMTPLPNGGHDILHLATILGMSTLVREICRHLLHHSDPESVEDFYAQDTNNMTALDFAILLQYKEIQEVLEMTLETAKALGKTISAYQSTSLGPNPSLKSSLIRPLPKLPSRERPNKATTMPIRLSPNMMHMQLPGTPPSPVPAHPAAIDRPLPPTPLSPSIESEAAATIGAATPPPPYIHTAQTATCSASATSPLPSTLAPLAMTAESEVTTATPVGGYEEPHPMYPPPTSVAPPTSYPPPSHPPPPAHTQPLPAMPVPVPSGHSHEYPSHSQPGLPPPMPASAPLPQVYPLYPPPETPPPPPSSHPHTQPLAGLGSSSSAFPAPQHLHYAPPSQPPPPPVPSLPPNVYPGSPPTVHAHQYYPPAHAPPPLPQHHQLHHHQQHLGSPLASPATIQTGKLPSLSGVPTAVPPPPPPRHKVTKVSRPKDFVIPTSRQHEQQQQSLPGTTPRRKTVA
ncbi:hypothetical protein BGW41_004983 [Actinomortierella wolfii]|nr:hypothetical protein BGW41_004983 [Actinomortierella wolfii]